MVSFWEIVQPERSSEWEPADSLRNEFNVIGGWLPSLTFALGQTEYDKTNDHTYELHRRCNYHQRRLPHEWL